MIGNLVLTLLLAFTARTWAAESKAHILYLNGSGQQDAMVEYWRAQGFEVHEIEVAHSDIHFPGVMLDSSVRNLFVAGSAHGAKLAINFSNSYALRVSGLILIEPEISGREALSPLVPVLVQRMDEVSPLKAWVLQQKGLGRNIRDVGFFEREEIYLNLGRRLTIDFAQAVLAGSLKRVVP